MEQMKSFIMWFLDNLPPFLLSEPICYFVGFFFLFAVVAVFRRIVGTGNKYL